MPESLERERLCVCVASRDVLGTKGCSCGLQSLPKAVLGYCGAPRARARASPSPFVHLTVPSWALPIRPGPPDRFLRLSAASGCSW